MSATKEWNKAQGVDDHTFTHEKTAESGPAQLFRESLIGIEHFQTHVLLDSDHSRGL